MRRLLPSVRAGAKSRHYLGFDGLGDSAWLVERAGKREEGGGGYKLVVVGGRTGPSWAVRWGE